jgi:periplasmic protein TonB
VVPAVVPVTPRGPLPTVDEPGVLPPDDAPAPCLHECDGTVPGGRGDGVIGDSPSVTGAPGPAPAPIRIHAGIKPPVRVVYVAPVYPDIAITARAAAIIVLDCTIAPDGRVVDIHVLRGHPLFTAAAVDAVRRWRYTPTLLNGVPVPVLMTVTVNFSVGK